MPEGYHSVGPFVLASSAGSAKNPTSSTLSGATPAMPLTPKVSIG
jgi:hypothetical protein